MVDLITFTEENIMIKGKFEGPPVSVLAAYVIVAEPVMAKIIISNTDPTRESVTKSIPLYISGIRETINLDWFLVKGTTENGDPIEIRISSDYKMGEWSIEINNEVSIY